MLVLNSVLFKISVCVYFVEIANISITGILEDLFLKFFESWHIVGGRLVPIDQQNISY